MAHGITEKDHMVSANEVPWHGLGTTLQLEGGRLMSRREAQDAARMNWRVSVRPLAVPRAQIESPAPGALRRWDWSDPIVDRDTRGIVRDDTGEILAHCGKLWTPFQNDDLFDLTDLLVESSEEPLRYDTAGTLWGGRKAWVCIRLGGDFGIRREDGTIDEIQKHLVVLNQHGDNVALRIYGTGVRPVCQNTINWGLGKATNVVAIPHLSNIPERAREVAVALRLENDYFAALRVEMEQLDRERMEREKLRGWVASVMSDLDGTYTEVVSKLEESKSDAYVERVKDAVDKVEVLFHQGEGNRGNSKYDALNGLTEFLDHNRRRFSRAKSQGEKMARRMDDLMFGAAVRTKARAVRLLRKA